MKAAIIRLPQEIPSQQMTELKEDEFITRQDLVGRTRELASENAQRILAQIREMFRNARWDDMIDLFYPLDIKTPEMSGSEHEASARANLAFALGQVKRFDDALLELEWCVAKEPDNFRFHSSLAYTAYNSLYAAKNRETFMHGSAKRDRMALALKHMEIAQNLKPESIANLYRKGMLVAEFEGKPELAVVSFMNAVTLWESKSAEDLEQMAHEKKHYIKSLYHAASCHMDKGSLTQAMDLIGRCIAQDKDIHHMGPVFKHFLKGKILFTMRRHDDAHKELKFAFAMKGDDPAEYVLELMARNLLAQGNAEKAMETIRRVPRNRKRPFCRWTEADILCALGRYDEAYHVLEEGLERDRRSRHKSLIRMVKIDYLHQRFEQAGKRAREAGRFFQESWGKPYGDAMFWEAAALLRLDQKDKARALAGELSAHYPWYPGLDRLVQQLG